MQNFVLAPLGADFVLAPLGGLISVPEERASEIQGARGASPERLSRVFFPNNEKDMPSCSTLSGNWGRLPTLFVSLGVTTQLQVSSRFAPAKTLLKLRITNRKVLWLRKGHSSICVFIQSHSTYLHIFSCTVVLFYGSDNNTNGNDDDNNSVWSYVRVAGGIC